MESKAALQRYRDSRKRLYVSLDQIRRDIDEWLDAHDQKSPRLQDLARLEALHAQRVALLEELSRREAEFMDSLLPLKDR